MLGNNIKKTVEFLKTVHILSSLSEEEIRIIAKRLNLIRVREGDILCKEGEEGNELYIIREGEIIGSIQLPSGKQKEIVVFHPGDFFGEMSIFENAPRSATCHAKQKGKIYRLHKNDFFSIIKSEPGIAIKMMYRMLNITTQRLRKTSKFLSDMVRWGDEASRRAITDELTGAYNRRFLDNSLDDYFETAKKNKKPLTLIMADLDYFRQINEAYGHEMGDKTILEVVKVFKKKLRETDILARYGGDEFTVLLPDTTLTVACNIAEEIRKEVEKLDFLSDMTGPVTSLSTSQGIASFPETADTLTALRKKADDALYQAKENGRNRVYCSKVDE
ncbi:MAG: GGDEF domain-containing protein [Spirochaetales bacterium]|nr:GGDEF domain-containing protein [Spirochaetales bacterium]